MTRAYLRLDPMFDERKSAYPDGAYRALIATFCLSEHQPVRGRFRSQAFLAALLEGRGKWVKYLLDKHDIRLEPDGRIYVVGWDEWQEGDHTVGDRVARIRSRRNTAPVTGDVTVSVTAPVSAGVTGHRYSYSGGNELPATSGDQSPVTSEEEPEGEALTWLAQHGCYIKPANGYHQTIVTLIERKGSPAVISAFERLSHAGVSDGDTKGFVFGATDLLNPRPNIRALEAEDRAEEREEAHRNRKRDPLIEEMKAAIVDRYGPGETA